MGLLGYFFHHSNKKKIEENIAWYKSQSPDRRAGMIFFVWLLRGLNLADLTGRGVTIKIPVYYYKKGAEVPLLECIKNFQVFENKSLCNAAHHHLYTNLAASYPEQGYGVLVRKMWAVLFEKYTDMNEVLKEMEPLLHRREFERLVEDNDVTKEQFARDPRLIMPHFLVPGHPLSARLVEEEKLGRYILGE